MAADAPGLRAMASAEAATALACANPQRPEAIAMAKPEVIATHLLTSSAPLISAPNIGLAQISNAIATRIIFVFTCVCSSSYEFASGGGSRHPLAAGLTLGGIMPLMIVRYGACYVHHRHESEDVGLLE